jgi:hypothetical protein
MRLKNRLQTNLQRFLKASRVFDCNGGSGSYRFNAGSQTESLYNVVALYRLILKALSFIFLKYTAMHSVLTLI